MNPDLLRKSRRTFLGDTGMGFTGMALSAMLFRDGKAATKEPVRLDAEPHFPAKAKSVIWIFNIGGVSHLESFDPKPMLNKYAGKTFDETPFAGVENEDEIKKALLDPSKAKREIYKTIMPLQTGYKRYGKSGIEVSDWFPEMGSMADDLTVARGMWTIDNNHGAQLTYHTGRKITEGAFPTIGSWVSYGLGTLNQNLPEFVVLGNPSADCCGAAWTHGASYLGPQHAGVRMKVDPKNPLSFVKSADDKLTSQEQAENFGLLGKLNRLAGIDYPDDAKLQARIKSYELAFQMQSAVPEVMDLEKEHPEIRKMYGLEDDKRRPFGEKCLAARRLVERGVRFVQIFHGYTGNAGAWDSHTKIKDNHSRLANEVDQPVAALIRDLKLRGLLDDTLVVWGSEFGRTPGAEFRKGKLKGDGRDHHPHGFNVVMAGGGTKKGHIYGATDELGFHAVENRHYVTDLHATVLHLMGLDPRALEVPGRKRLEKDFGEVMHGVIA
ncbi:MAG: sulfatase [Verrucomicrobiales bacterium]|nr:sulfatase [Verrucomicrobiales bacterium]